MLAIGVWEVLWCDKNLKYYQYYTKEKIKLVLVMSMGTKVTAIYNEGVLKLMEKVDLPEKAKVRITISVNFSKLLDEVGEIEAKEDIDKVLGNMRTRDYYG